MHTRFRIAVVAALSILLSSCSGPKPEEVSVDLGAEFSADAKENNTVDFSDSALPTVNEPKPTFGEKLPDTTATLADKSEVATLHDGAGNTIEMRNFKNGSRIAMIVAKTTPDGWKEVVVYGYNGERRTLPEGIRDRAMTESEAVIAGFAGIFSERRLGLRQISGSQAKPGSISQPAPRESETTKKDTGNAEGAPTVGNENRPAMLTAN